MSALMDGEEIPVINGCRLAVTAQRGISAQFCCDKFTSKQASALKLKA
jgi:hypothetical protein